MKKANFSTSACRLCRFYEPEGRRGGSCQMLGVPVKSNWSACKFALPPFINTLEKLENSFQLPVSNSSDVVGKAVAKVIDSNLKDDRSPVTTPTAE